MVTNTKLETIKGAEETPSHIYVNMSIINNETGDVSEDKQPLCQLSETSNGSILDEAGNYELSVIKFSMDGVTQFLPALHFYTTTDSIDQGIYSVTLECEKELSDGSGKKTFISRQWVEWEPEDETIVQPPNPSDIGSSYYEAHSVTYVVNLFNIALEKARSDINTQMDSDPDTGDALEVKAPVLSQVENDLVSFTAPVKGYGISNPVKDEENWTAYINENSYNAFKTLPYAKVDEDQGRKFRILVGEQLSNVLTDLPIVDSSGNEHTELFYSLTQEFASLGSYWSPVESLVLINRGGDLNINDTFQSTPIRFGDSNFGKSGLNNQNYTESIITEFSIDKSNPRAWTENLLYTPDKYRWYSLLNTGQVKNINLQWFWRQRLTGELKELRMPNQSTCHISLLFRLKQ